MNYFLFTFLAFFFFQKSILAQNFKTINTQTPTKVFSINTKTTLDMLEESTDGIYLVGGKKTGELFIWNKKTPDTLFASNNFHAGELNFLKFNNNILFTGGGSKKSLNAWFLSENMKAKEILPVYMRNTTDYAILLSHTKAITFLDEKKIIVVDGNKRFSYWREAEPSATITKKVYDLVDFALFLADSEVHILATHWEKNTMLVGSGTGNNGKLLLVKEATSLNKKHKETLHNFDSPVVDIKVLNTPETKLIIVKTEKDGIFVFDEKMKLVEKFAHNQYDFPTFSPTENLLAMVKLPQTIEIFDTKNWQKLQSWEAHTDKITALAWASKGYLLHSAGNDNKINTWFFSETLRNVANEQNKILEKFLVKDPYETQAEYQARITPQNQKIMLDSLFDDHVTQIAKNIFFAKPSQMEYNVETGIAKFYGNFSHTFFAKIKGKDAKIIQPDFKNANFQFSKLRYTLQKGEFFLTQAEIKLKNDVYEYDFFYAKRGEKEIFSQPTPLKNSSPTNTKEEIIANKDKEKLSETKEAKEDFPEDALKESLMKNKENLVKNIEKEIFVSELAKNIPQSKTKFSQKNKDNVAVIIGNKDYQHTQPVNFALNDAQTMKKYLVEVLGYNEKNIIYLENAKNKDFSLIFGTKNNHKGKLFNMIKPQKSEVFLYYAGHGAPNLADNKKSYLVPTDAEVEFLDLTAFDTDILYDNLALLPTTSVTVVIDACFSGEGIYKNVSPIRIKSKGAMGLKNGALMASCGADQVSAWYNEKEHSLFTYFFLKAIQDQNADKNKDKKLTLSEIFQYVDDQAEGVPYFARRLHNVPQNPVLKGQNIDKVLVEW